MEIFKIDYDSRYLDFVTVALSDEFKSMSYDYNVVPGSGVGRISMASARSCDGGDADLLTIQFHRKGTAAAGTGTVNVTEVFLWNERGHALAASISENSEPYEFPNNPHPITLEQNSPNPFNPSTTIHYTLSSDTFLHIVLNVYDIRGVFVRNLVDGSVNNGNHSVAWDGKDSIGNPVSGGVYLYTLLSGNYTRTRKMMLVK